MENEDKPIVLYWQYTWWKFIIGSSLIVTTSQPM